MALIMGKQSKQSILEQESFEMLRNELDEGDGSKDAEHVRKKHNPQQRNLMYKSDHGRYSTLKINVKENF